MGTIECSQLASKSSWDSQDFGDISMVLKMAHFRKSTGPQWVKIFWPFHNTKCWQNTIFCANEEFMQIEEDIKKVC